MPLIQLTLSEPIPDLECLNCGRVHRYDGIGEWEECLVLKDTRFIPPQVACRLSRGQGTISNYVERR